MSGPTDDHRSLPLLLSPLCWEAIFAARRSPSTQARRFPAWDDGHHSAETFIEHRSRYRMISTIRRALLWGPEDCARPPLPFAPLSSSGSRVVPLFSVAQGGNTAAGGVRGCTAASSRLAREPQSMVSAEGNAWARGASQQQKVAYGSAHLGRRYFNIDWIHLLGIPYAFAVTGPVLSVARQACGLLGPSPGARGGEHRGQPDSGQSGHILQGLPGELPSRSPK
jgi:hypothetical protein